MSINQLSIFIENKSGRLNEVLDVVGKSNIRIIAATVADTSEFGILRLITTDTPAALKVLQAHKISANLNEVIALTCDSLVGSFATQLACFTQAGVSIEYMYCFSSRCKSFVILRVNDTVTAQEVIRKHRLTPVTEEELITL